MKKILLSYRALSTDIALLLLRVSIASLLLFSHGWPKLANFDEKAGSFTSVLGTGSNISLSLAVFAEVFCSALVILGLFTRLALVPLIVMMLVIVFIIHADDPFGKQELALLYFIPFFAIFLTGPGKYSLDHLFKLS